MGETGTRALAGLSVKYVAGETQAARQAGEQASSDRGGGPERRVTGRWGRGQPLLRTGLEDAVRN